MPTILTIEDNPDYRLFIVICLQMEGFTVFEAENGLLGIDMAKTVLPDLILCDINMPEMNGLEVLKELKKAPITNKIPFIFLTSEDDKEIYNLAKEMGANSYWNKDLRCEEIIGRIKNILGGNNFAEK